MSPSQNIRGRQDMAYLELPAAACSLSGLLASTLGELTAKTVGAVMLNKTRPDDFQNTQEVRVLTNSD